MPTGFDLLTHDPTLRKHWLKRFLAMVVDLLLIFIPINILMLLLGWSSGSVLYLMGGFVAGFAWFGYSALMDYAVRGSIGKLLMGLRVVPIRGRLELYQTMMRNLSKVFLLFLAIDFLAGLLIDTTDPRQKYSDRVAGTSVIVHEGIPF